MMLHSRVVNYAPRAINKLSIMLLENIYNTSITHDDHHLRLSYFYRTGRWSEANATEAVFLVMCNPSMNEL
jgi:hypothetical protein